MEKGHKAIHMLLSKSYLKNVFIDYNQYIICG